jgi:RHS repeat-associated protein
MALSQPTGVWTNAFAFDEFLRLTNVTSPAGQFGYEYAPGSGGSSGFCSALVQRLLLPNSSIITNQFDPAARLLDTYLRTSSGILTNKHLYQYDGASQRTNTTRMDGSTVGYLFDNIGQLTVVNDSVGGQSRGYYYDAAWNLNRRTNGYGGVATFGVDSLNQLTTTLDGATTYDANGNLVSSHDGYWVYSYDDENRLIQLTRYSTIIGGTDKETLFYYDGLSRLRIRQELHYECSGGGDDSAQGIGDADTGGGGNGCNWVVDSETWYIYDGRRVIQERDGNNTPLRGYTRGNDLSGSMEDAGGIGGLLSRSEYLSANWTNHAYYHADGNGNITFMEDSSEAMAAWYRYDPYGNLLSSGGSLGPTNVYRFSSKEIHLASGMYYYLFRFYDPNLQRWINRDPLGEWGSINLFRFARHSPTTAIDPDGDSDQNVVFTVTAPPGAGLALTAAPTTFIGPSSGTRVPYPTPSAPNPFTYDGLLIGAPHLIGTPLGYRIAQHNADLYTGMLPGASCGSRAAKAAARHAAALEARHVAQNAVRAAEEALRHAGENAAKAGDAAAKAYELFGFESRQYAEAVAEVKAAESEGLALEDALRAAQQNLAEANASLRSCR